MSHNCHAYDCYRRVQPKMLFCGWHWSKLRKPLQNAIWKEYRPGQERDKNPSVRYLAVQRLAVGEIAFRPHNEAAARVMAACVIEAQKWRLLAIERGDGDPLEGLLVDPVPLTRAQFENVGALGAEER